MNLSLLPQLSHPFHTHFTDYYHPKPHQTPQHIMEHIVKLGEAAVEEVLQQFDGAGEG